MSQILCKCDSISIHTAAFTAPHLSCLHMPPYLCYPSHAAATLVPSLSRSSSHATAFLPPLSRRSIYGATFTQQHSRLSIHTALVQQHIRSSTYAAALTQQHFFAALTQQHLCRRSHANFVPHLTRHSISVFQGKIRSSRFFGVFGWAGGGSVRRAVFEKGCFGVGWRLVIYVHRRTYPRTVCDGRVKSRVGGGILGKKRPHLGKIRPNLDKEYPNLDKEYPCGQKYSRTGIKIQSYALN